MFNEKLLTAPQNIAFRPLFLVLLSGLSELSVELSLLTTWVN